MGYPFFPYTVKAAQEAGIEDVSEINRNCGFATRLRGLRTGAELSQAALAKALGIVKSTLGLYETGDTVPDARTLCAIANYFEVSSDWLLGLSSVKERNADLQAICDYTGLTPQTIGTISGVKNFGYLMWKPVQFINYMVEHPKFRELARFLLSSVAYCDLLYASDWDAEENNEARQHKTIVDYASSDGEIDIDLLKTIFDNAYYDGAALVSLGDAATMFVKMASDVFLEIAMGYAEWAAAGLENPMKKQAAESEATADA